MSENWTNLVLDDEQEMIRETARKFAEDALAARAEELDHAATFSKEVFEQISELGFCGLTVSENGGGAGLGQLVRTIALEELARASGSVAFALDAHLEAAMLLDRFGGDGMAETTQACAMGEQIATVCLGSAGANPSDGFVASGEGDAVTLSGSQGLVPLASAANVFVVVATSGEGDAAETAFYVVAADASGVAVTDVAPPLGMRSCGWAQVTLSASPGQRLAGDGAAQLAEFLQSARLADAAIALGLGEEALQRSAQYAQERIAFGKPLSKQQAVAFKLANVSAQIEGVRQQVYHASRCADAGTSDARDAAHAKMLATEAAVLSADEAIQILGGYGFVTEYHVERMYRDAKTCEVAHGSNEACRKLIAATILSS